MLAIALDKANATFLQRDLDAASASTHIASCALHLLLCSVFKLDWLIARFDHIFLGERATTVFYLEQPNDFAVDIVNLVC